MDLSVSWAILGQRLGGRATMVQVGPRAATTAAPASPHAPPATEAPTAPSEERALGRRRYSIEIPIDPDYLPFLGLMLVGLVLRFWDLGFKALHHDESLHAFYAYLLFGASDFTARLVPALFGIGLIGLPFFLRHELGKAGAVAASAILVVSPSFLYFSRFIRHDIYVDFFTLLLAIGVFRYLATGQRGWFYTACTSAALLFATKEDFYISGFIPFVFLLGSWFLLKGDKQLLFRARVRALGVQAWGSGVLIFLVVNVILYTTFLTNPRGVCTAVVSLPFDSCAGLKGALNYWWEQQDFARGGQPWFYYFMLLPLYEFVPLILGVLAIFLVRPRQHFFWFCTFWFIAGLLIYSWAGEKMPWMLPQITLPLVLLAGRLLGEWSDAGWGKRALTSRGLATGGLILVAMLALLAWIGL